jgi:hypothetical protein
MSSKPFCEKSKEVLQYIDKTKPVYVYRNLHKQCLSVRQDGIVMCHAENVVLMDCEFKVNEKGRDRVREDKQKNVHAGIKGFVVDARRSLELLDFGWESVYYNPYTTDWWQLESVPYDQYVDRAGWCDIHADPIGGASVLAFDVLYKTFDVNPLPQTT